jgi:hypothetical protein
LPSRYQISRQPWEAPETRGAPGLKPGCYQQHQSPRRKND